jgi:DNA-binding transcriptional LysR family regulator
VAQIVTVIPLVAAGFGVSIVPRSFRDVHFGGVSYIDIDGEAPRGRLALVYRRDERSVAVKNVVKAARMAKLSS